MYINQKNKVFKKTFVIIILSGIFCWWVGLARASPNAVNKIDISDAIIDDFYKIQLDISLNDFSEQDVLVNTFDFLPISALFGKFRF